MRETPRTTGEVLDRVLALFPTTTRVSANQCLLVLARRGHIGKRTEAATQLDKWHVAELKV